MYEYLIIFLREVDYKSFMELIHTIFSKIKYHGYLFPCTIYFTEVMDKSNRKAHSRQEPQAVAGKGLRFGNFELIESIAQGGMGRIYRARHIYLHKQAAVKVLKSEFSHSPEILERFQKEAQALARVNHPNVVQVLDVGKAHGHVYIAMDFAPGMNLQKWLKRDGALERENFLYVSEQIIQGIAAAHEAGILHRDIKPENIIVNHKGRVKITDFGLAGKLQLIKSGNDQQSFATPAYTAPEVLQGKPADGRSDVFSLGVTLYHLASGVLPFGRAPLASVLLRQHKGAGHLSELRTDLPKPFVKTIMRSIAYQAEERPEQAHAFLHQAFPHSKPFFLLRIPQFVTLSLLCFILVAASFGSAWFFSNPQTKKALEDKQGSSESQLLRQKLKDLRKQKKQSRSSGFQSGSQKEDVHNVFEEQEKELFRREMKRNLKHLERRLELYSDPEQNAFRLALIKEFLQDYHDAPAALVERAQKWFEQEAAAYRQKRRLKLIELQSQAEELSPRQARQKFKATPAYLLESTLEDESEQEFLEELKSLDTLIQTRNKKVRDDYHARIVELQEERPFEALELLQEMTTRVNGEARFASELKENIAQAAYQGYQGLQELWQEKRRQAFNLRVKQSQELLGEFSSLDEAVRFYRVHEAEQALEDLSQGLNPLLMPAVESFRQELLLLQECYDWLFERFKQTSGQEVELVVYADSARRRLIQKKVKVVSIGDQKLRLQGWDQREFYDLSIYRLHPDTWRPLIEANDQEEKDFILPRFLRLELAQGRKEAARRVAGLVGEFLPVADEELRFAGKAYRFLHLIVWLDKIEKSAQGFEQDLLQAAKERFDALGIQALEALVVARGGEEGYAEKVRGLDAAWSMEAYLAEDVLRAPLIESWLDTYQSYLPDDPFVSAARIALKRERFLSAPEKFSKLDFYQEVKLAYGKNPYDQFLWHLLKELQSEDPQK